MISVDINSERKQFEKSLSISDLVSQLGYVSEDIAVAVNGEFVPRNQYASHQIVNNDQLDIVAPVQGG